MNSPDPSIDAPSECPARDEVAAYTRGELDHVAVQRIDAHRKRCDLCADFFREEELFCELQRAFRVDHDETWQTSEEKSGITAAGEINIDGYEIGEEIHRGGQGVVYAAMQLATNRRVALKVMLNGGFASDRQRLRFEREVDLIARLKHPNIVTIFDSGIEQGRQYFAMQFVDGETLDVHARRVVGNDLESPKRRELQQFLEKFCLVCDAVAYAHQSGVIHRDLKPANILIDHEGIPHVLDFGLAKSLLRDSKTEARQLEPTRTGEFLGTLAYASPEQARGDVRQLDIRSDVYSLGVILYESLTGDLPYDVSGSLVDIMRTISEVDAKPISQSARWIEHDLATIVMKSLDIERARRYVSAEHLARDIRHYLVGEPIDAKRDSAWYVLQKSIKKHRWIVLTSTSVAIVVLISLIMSLVFWSRAIRDRDAAILASDRQLIATEEANQARVTEQRQRVEAQRQKAEADRQRREAEFVSYVSSLSAAARARQMFDVQDSLKKLLQAPQHLRKWEWYHFSGLLDDSRTLLTEHSSYVESVVFSPDGRYFASASWDHVVCLWDAKTEQLIHSFRCEAPVWRLCFDQTGRHLAAAVWNGSVTVWELDTFAVYHEFEGPADVINGLDIDPHTNLLVATFQNRYATDPAVEPTTKVWNLETRELIAQWELARPPNDIAIQPGGELVAVAGPGLTLYRTRTGEEVQQLHQGVSRAVSFSKDGLQVASGARNEIVIHDVVTFEAIAWLSGHGADIYSLRFGPDDQKLISAARDKTIRIWDRRTNRLERVLCGHQWVITSVDIDRSGERLISGSWDQSIRTWDGLGEHQSGSLAAHQAPVTSVGFSERGLLATASRDGRIKLWDVAAKRCLATLEGHRSAVLALAFHPGQNVLASGANDGTIRLWDLEKKELLREVEAHDRLAHALCFSPDGTHLISGSGDNSLYVWETSNYQRVNSLVGHEDHIHVAAFSPNGRWLITGGHESLRIWDGHDYHRIARVERQMIADDYSLAVHPDGRRMAAGSNLQTITIWDIETQQAVHELVGHTDEIHTVAFNPSGQRLASASFDNTVKLWDVESGREVATLFDFAGHPNCVTFGPQGFYLVVGLDTGEVRILTGAIDEPYQLDVSSVENDKP